MSRRLTVCLLLVMAISAGADDGDLPKARVVDTNLVRVPVQTVAPSYPRIARRDRVEGVVTVCFEIDRKGRPRRVAVRSSTARVFEKPSVKAVKASSFRAIEKGIPVPQIKSCRTFVYSLEPSSGGPS